MGYLSEAKYKKIGFKSVGKDCLISDKAVFYRPERISIGSYCKIDDFAVFGNNIEIHDYCHISLDCHLLSSNNAKIILHDFVSLSHRVTIFTNTDNYVDGFLSGPIVCEEYSQSNQKDVILHKHALVGAYSLIFPGVVLGEGSSIGAMSMVNKSTQEWSVSVGIPAREIKLRDKDGILQKEKEFLESKKLNTGFLSLLSKRS